MSRFSSLAAALPAALLLTLLPLSAARGAPISYFEAISGDLVHADPLTTFTLDTGLNTVNGTTTFTGYAEDSTEGRVVAVIASATDEGELEIFLDRTPFYAESGGQVGDTGTITTDSGTAEVLDTTFALPNLRRHRARITTGESRIE